MLTRWLAWWRPSAGRSSSPRIDPRRLGQHAERLAARFLRRRGYRVLAANIRLRHAEADLVCLAPDRRTIVIVEVKSRRRAHPDLPGPELAVDARKRARLLAAAHTIARLNHWLDRPMRIDVVAIDFPPPDRTGRPQLRHIIDAVRDA